MFEPSFLNDGPLLLLCHRFLHVFESGMQADLLLEGESMLFDWNIVERAPGHQFPDDQTARVHVNAQERVPIEADCAWKEKNMF